VIAMATIGLIMDKHLGTTMKPRPTEPPLTPAQCRAIAAAAIKRGLLVVGKRRGPGRPWPKKEKADLPPTGAR